MTRAEIFRELASLVEAGVPLDTGLRQLGPRLPSKWRKAAAAWAEHLAQGQSLSFALAAVPPRLDPADQALLEAAELSGRTGRCLHELAHAAEAAERRRSKLSTALIYPVLLFHGAAVIPAFLTYTQSGAVAAAFQVACILIPGYLLVGGLAALIGLRHRPGPPHPMLALLDVIPMLGRGLRLAATSRFCAILAGLLESGIRIESALERAASAAGDARIRHRVSLLAPKVRDAGTLPTALLAETGYFDETTLTILQGGETTGELPAALRRAADRAEFTAHQQLDRAALLGPVICYLFAVLVAVAQIFRMLAPLFQTYGGLLDS
jgi:type II secretory pathway component PulF